MRVYRCRTEGCGRGLITEMQQWGFCPKCGGQKWGKLRKSSYWTMLRIWWISGRKLVVPPEGSKLERFLMKRFEDQSEYVVNERELRAEVPAQFMEGGSRG